MTQVRKTATYRVVTDAGGQRQEQAKDQDSALHGCVATAASALRQASTASRFATACTLATCEARRSP